MSPEPGTTSPSSKKSTGAKSGLVDIAFLVDAHCDPVDIQKCQTYTRSMEGAAAHWVGESFWCLGCGRRASSYTGSPNQLTSPGEMDMALTLAFSRSMRDAGT